MNEMDAVILLHRFEQANLIQHEQWQIHGQNCSNDIIDCECATARTWRDNIKQITPLRENILERMIDN